MIDKSENMTIKQTCPNCQTITMMRYEGLQWWPERFLVRQGLEPVQRDECQHPNEGALRMFSCEQCESSFLEPTLARVG
jgi:hypothetical protein